MHLLSNAISDPNLNSFQLKNIVHDTRIYFDMMNMKVNVALEIYTC